MKRFSAIHAVSAIAALAMMQVGPAVEPVEEYAAAPSPRPRKRPVRTVTVQPTVYAAKVPTSPFDFARLEAAEQKRARKAAKLRTP